MLDNDTYDLCFASSRVYINHHTKRTHRLTLSLSRLTTIMFCWLCVRVFIPAFFPGTQLWRFQHRHVVHVYGAVMQPSYVALVMELCERGSLYSVLHDDDQYLSWPTRMQIVRDVAAGVDFLHSQHMLHRDLKSLNVLLTATLTPKLCDFGFAILKTDTESHFGSLAPSAIGTVRWTSPEVMQGNRT